MLSALVTTTLVVSSGSASAGPTPQDLAVSADPADFTPHVLDGRVYAVAEVGNTIVLGGEFTQVRNAAAGSPTLVRFNLVAFDKSTGAISTTFAPVVDDVVRTLVAAPDGQSVYVGGKFGFIDGVRAYKLARLNIATGAPVAGFNPGLIDAVVMDARLNGDRLFISGIFRFVNGVPQAENDDFRVEGRMLVFGRPLQKEGRLGFWRWLSIFLGLVGTYRQNDSVDVQYRAGGRERFLTGLDIVPPAAEEARN